MRTVHELNQNELEELRSNYFYQLLETDSEILDGIDSPCQIDICNIVDHYDGISFTDEDFFCNL